MVGTMVPGTPGFRLALLFAHVRHVPYAALDRAAGVAEGTAKQCARGRKVGPRAADAFATIFGATADWVLFERGEKPRAEAVRLAVTEALEALGKGSHAAEPTRSRTSRKRRARSVKSA